jgi:hypothetical protein
MGWYIVYGLAALALFLHWRGPNAVWGTATMGFIIGLVVEWVREGFDWSMVWRIISIGVFVGVFFEWAPRLTRRWAQEG